MDRPLRTVLVLLQMVHPFQLNQLSIRLPLLPSLRMQMRLLIDTPRPLKENHGQVMVLGASNTLNSIKNF